ncbi:MAG TPA: hypothetical protein VLM89_03490 [Phycisphaerae bacterium]|nr:hypothetical protein [Phycisphaerae bacterium]
MKKTILQSNALWMIVLSVGVACPAASAELQVLGVHFRADQPYPQYHRLWHEDSNDPEIPEGAAAEEASVKEPLGASIHVLVRNTGTSPLKIEDLFYAGESLKGCLVYSDQRKVRKFASITFANLPPDRLKKLVAAGEPIWMKADPLTLPPGAAGQVMVRTRRMPPGENIALALKCGPRAIPVTVPLQPRQPRLAGVSFSPDLREVYLYFRHPEKGKAPVKVLLDGTDVTGSAVVSRDATLNISPVVMRLSRPLARGSFHVFQGVYDDGQTASAGLRAWSDEFGYGMWGGPPGKSEDEAIARNYILDLTAHNINLQVAQIGSPPVQAFLRNPAGQQFAAARGLRFIPDEPQKWGVRTPYMMFIHDEPDCADHKMEGVAEAGKIGGLAQWCIQRANEIRVEEPDELSMLNVDNTYKPQNWYIYGQLADVLSIDPYYQPRLRTAAWERPERLATHSKATYVLGASQVARSACEPNPLHVILYACSIIDGEKKRAFPFPTPESKRIEAYYALAAGAKGLSYWWYTPSLAPDRVKSKVSHGVGAGSILGDPAAGALWREIGLVGAEVRTLGPVLMTGCPAGLELQATKGLRAWSLIAGQDTLVLPVVTDQYANSEQGTKYDPIAKASLTVNLPSWIKSPTVFEVTAGGIRDVPAKTADRELTVDLGKVNLTRMIVVTEDNTLRKQLQSRYEKEFKAKAAALVKGHQKP